jgi:hypothetical protein
MVHSDDGTTRRELLTGAGLAAAGTLAACSSLDSRERGTETETECLTNVTSEMDGRGLREVRIEGDDPVTLVVELTDHEETLSEVEFLYVGATGEELKSYVPYRRLAEADGPAPPLTYESPLEAAPHHDEYTVYLDAVEERQTLDARTVSLSCD